ncbi:MAG: TonB-dependent receptor [Bacteroidaceae bacterium]|nr:TonB-dependent receptor [Bacteroidaceae bacterium]
MKHIASFFILSTIVWMNVLPAQSKELTTFECEQLCVPEDTLLYFYPTYPGGEEALHKFLKKNMSFPQMLKDMEAEGECVMRFTVNTDGSISDIVATDCRVTQINTAKLMRYSDEEQTNIRRECARQMAKEGLRLIRKMKRWNPATRNGIAVAVNFSLKLSFSLDYVD